MKVLIFALLGIVSSEGIKKSLLEKAREYDESEASLATLIAEKNLI